MDLSAHPSTLHQILDGAASIPPRPLSDQTLAVLTDCSSKTELTGERIRQLKNGEAVCVVTGQQLGFLLGPAFTLYKIASAIALAEKYRERTGRPAVPIFWLQSDDHDFEEIRVANIPDEEGGLYRLELPANVEADRVSVGLRMLPPEASELVSELGEKIHPIADKLSVLSAAYQAGKSYRQSFAELVSSVFHGTDLLIYDPQHPLAKAEASPLFQRSLDELPEFEQAIESSTQEFVRAGQKEQVALRPGSPLFFVHFPDRNGPRFRMQKRQNRYEAIGGDFVISHEELRKITIEEPERISTSALLRPLLQDSLLPTLAYVGGDAEIRYLQQLRALYSHLKISQPFAVRRLSLFVIEPRSRRVLESLGVEPRTFISDPKAVEARVRGEAPSPEDLKAQTEAALAELLERLLQKVAPLAGEMSAVMRRSTDKMQRALAGVLHRYRIALENRHDVDTLRYRKALDLIFPEGEPQERVISSAYYWAKYGETFMDALRADAAEWSETLETTPRIISVGD